MLLTLLQSGGTPSNATIVWLKVSGTWRMSLANVNVTTTWKQSKQFVKVSGIWK